MKYSRFLLGSICTVFSAFSAFQTYADWIEPGTLCDASNATDVTGQTNRSFPKPEGKKVLCVKEKVVTRPWTNINQNIQLTAGAAFFGPRNPGGSFGQAGGGSCSVTYTIDGTPWNPNDAKWNDSKYHDLMRTDTLASIKEAQPNCTQLTGETRAPNPNATVDTWSYSTKEYWYDQSNPYCGGKEFFELQQDGGWVFSNNYTGGWTNKRMGVRFACDDQYAGCRSSFSSIYTLVFRASRVNTVGLSDIVDNGTSAACDLGTTYLYDPTMPTLTLTDDAGNTLIDKNSVVISNPWSYYAGTRKWHAEIIDDATRENDGISGIKSFSATIVRQGDMSTVCSWTKTYLSQPDGYSAPDSRQIALDCGDTSGIQKSGEYVMNIRFEDYAGNTKEFRQSIFIAPNKTVDFQGGGVPLPSPQQLSGTQVCATPKTVSECADWHYDEKSCINNYEYHYYSLDQFQNMPDTAKQCSVSLESQESSVGIRSMKSERGAEERSAVMSDAVGSFLGTNVQKFQFATTTTYNIRSCDRYESVDIGCDAYTSGTDYRDIPDPTSVTNIAANLSDQYLYTLPALVDSYDNPIYDKNYAVVHVGSGIFLIQGNPSSGSAITLTPQAPHTNRSGVPGKFAVRSYAPGIYTNNFQIQLEGWNPDYTPGGDPVVVDFGHSEEKKFTPLYYVQSVAVSDGQVIFGQKQTLTYLFGENRTAGTSPRNVQIDLTSSLKATPENVWSMRNIHAGNSITANKASLDFIGVQQSSGSNIDIQSIPKISYTIAGKGVQYALSASKPVIPSDGTDVTWDWKPLDPINPDVITTQVDQYKNGIYIGGQNQTTGQSNLVDARNSIGENALSTVTTTIKRNVALLTRNRTPDESVAGGIKYTSGNQLLSGNVDWQTLIVEDGNITFDGDFNTDKKNIAIILINKNNPTLGNIFIKPDVQFIGATIYADGFIESVDYAGNPFVVSDENRTLTLNDQIVFVGGLYTHNTVGGATLGADGHYLLPGGKKTDDINQAVRFDLSWLRMNDKGANLSMNQGHTESVVVLQNTEALTNPPPGFARID